MLHRLLVLSYWTFRARRNMRPHFRQPNWPLEPRCLDNAMTLQYWMLSMTHSYTAANISVDCIRLGSPLKCNLFGEIKGLWPLIVTYLVHLSCPSIKWRESINKQDWRKGEILHWCSQILISVLVKGHLILLWTLPDRGHMRDGTLRQKPNYCPAKARNTKMSSSVS